MAPSVSNPCQGSSRVKNAEAHNINCHMSAEPGLSQESGPVRDSMTPSVSGPCQGSSRVENAEAHNINCHMSAEPEQNLGPEHQPSTIQQDSQPERSRRRNQDWNIHLISQSSTIVQLC